MNILTTIKDGAVRLWSDFEKYVNVSGELIPQNEAELSVRSGVSFKGSNLLVLIFAIIIASVGLNTNSVPVIIGAMIISPLMGPIIGMGVAIGIEDYGLLKRSLRNISMAVVGSLLASAVYFLISPIYEGASQLLARTSPSVYDVLVALFGGGAGILSIACRNRGSVMPGVAIATSLMPPLCTAGYGLATFQLNFLFGALYLFFINMIFILFASWIGVKLMGYRKVVYQDSARYKRIKFVVYTLVFITVGVSIFLTVQMLRKNAFLARASEFVDTEMVFPNTQVLSKKIYMKNGKRYIDVNLIGEALPKDSLQLAMMQKMDSVGLGGATLNITQGFSLGRDIPGTQTDDKAFYALMQQQLDRKDSAIDSLRTLLELHEAFSDIGVTVSPEVKVLFPNVKDIAVSRMVASAVDTNRVDTVNMAFVNAPAGLSAADRRKLCEYLEIRLKKGKVDLTLNPQGFPWPQ